MNKKNCVLHTCKGGNKEHAQILRFTIKKPCKIVIDDDDSIFLAVN